MKRLYSRYLLQIQCLSLSCFLLVSCGGGKTVDRQAIIQEMQDRELKRVLPGELTAKGETMAISILSQVQSQFQSKLMQAIDSAGLSGALEYCQLNASDLVKQFDDSLGVKITRVSNRTRNPADSIQGFQKEVYGAYQYAGQELPLQIQELDKEYLIATKPIMINTGLCLNCHGKPGQELSLELHEKIKSLYPQDSAINYQMNDMRGMWSLLIPRKAVIQQL